MLVTIPAGRWLQECLFLELSENQAGVLATEAECVGENDPYALFPGLVGNIVQIAQRVGNLIINGGVNHSVGYTLNAGRRLQRARRAQ